MKAVITGGAGFIGSNLAHRLIGEGHQVVVYDDLSRLGTDKNVAWLRATHGDRWALVQADVCDFETLRETVAGADVVYHLAAQVAVTTAVEDPRHDFQVNALGEVAIGVTGPALQHNDILHAPVHLVGRGVEHQGPALRQAGRL